MQAVVERELELRLVLSPERSVAVPARLTYRSADPYAVRVTFHLDSPAPVEWVFARELLVEGVFRACGAGDVRVWPSRSGSRGVVTMALSSPDGQALLEVATAPLSAWLERTLRLVPPGTEQGHLRLGEAVADWLAGETDAPRAADPAAGQGPDGVAGAAGEARPGGAEEDRAGGPPEGPRSAAG
ncbi:SsgA family sporulation/cell division regulator [Streptomyces sp. NPDC059740]|uniref:SsgA family sporulation/cell division regulator n=1 Tax=Streptomyces sp. NPDC059740 TaxID=3346926 RepID=UPI00366957E9